MPCRRCVAVPFPLARAPPASRRPRAACARSYDDRGFAVGEHRHESSLMCFASLLLRWHPRTAADVTLASFAPALLLRPRPELILFGSGARLQRLDPAIRKARAPPPAAVAPSARCCSAPPALPTLSLLHPVHRQGLLKEGILVEELTTQNAVATYNVLTQEGRSVLGALLLAGSGAPPP